MVFFVLLSAVMATLVSPHITVTPAPNVPTPAPPEVKWHFPVQSILEAAVSKVTDGLEEKAQQTPADSMRHALTD